MYKRLILFLMKVTVCTKRNHHSSYSLLVLLTGSFILLSSCERIDFSRIVKLQTGEISSITATSVKVEGIIIDTGEHGISRHGHCWAEHDDPSINGSGDFSNNLGDTRETGVYSSEITGLSPDVKYFVRAYAVSGEGEIAYGESIDIRTRNGLVTITTSDPESMTAITIVCGGTIADDGGSPVTERGICWGTDHLPTTAINMISGGSGTGDFNCTLSPLIGNIIYYIRAYATNGTDTYYGNEVTATIWYNVAGSDYADADGNVYNTVKLGSQTWMVQNLKTTKFNDGEDIPLETDNYTWFNLNTPACCWYENYISNKDTYGALYNWYTVNTGKLCPAGWHVPIDSDWQTLKDFLESSGGDAGGMLKDTSDLWASPNTGATSSSGFKGIPGGIRGHTDGICYYLGYTGKHWSGSPDVSDQSAAWTLSFDDSQLRRGVYDNNLGVSVRCVHD
jgi:uncharacterized protein (TIGR02145 family)